MISGNLQGIKQLKPFLTGNLVKALAFMEKIDFSTYKRASTNWMEIRLRPTLIYMPPSR